jgi:hypothetical protein
MKPRSLSGGSPESRKKLSREWVLLLCKRYQKMGPSGIMPLFFESAVLAERGGDRRRKRFPDDALMIVSRDDKTDEGGLTA